MKSAQRITKHAVEAADEVHDEIEAIKTSFKELRGDVVDLISHAFGVGRGGAHVAQGTATDAVDQLKKRLVELKDLGGDHVAAVERRIEERPVQSALIAMGIGFVLAMLFSRR
jgi:ElaB/YqjD/DUF883 family membrane-anchored ribosome-binding protein